MVTTQKAKPPKITIQTAKEILTEEGMKLTVFIDDYLIRRGSNVPDDFFSTDNPFALVFKPVFGRSMGIYTPQVWWEDHNGYAHSVYLPFEASNWLDAFYWSTVEKRLEFRPISFQVTLPTSRLTSEIAEGIRNSKYITAPYIGTVEYWNEMKFWQNVN